MEIVMEKWRIHINNISHEKFLFNKKIFEGNERNPVLKAFWDICGDLGRFLSVSRPTPPVSYLHLTHNLHTLKYCIMKDDNYYLCQKMKNEFLKFQANLILTFSWNTFLKKYNVEIFWCLWPSSNGWRILWWLSTWWW